MSLRGGTTEQSHHMQNNNALATKMLRYVRNDIVRKNL
jgi:hypothetical protein